MLTYLDPKTNLSSIITPLPKVIRGGLGKSNIWAGIGWATVVLGILILVGVIACCCWCRSTLKDIWDWCCKKGRRGQPRSPKSMSELVAATGDNSATTNLYVEEPTTQGSQCQDVGGSGHYEYVDMTQLPEGMMKMPPLPVTDEDVIYVEIPEEISKAQEKDN